ncbi:MAG: hypothetical protein LBF33_00115 [Oscillospiraceae bacterium]|jgi:hypothetical protein|nr:hypothetical protein [Oscillospiraceae bacterium]
MDFLDKLIIETDYRGHVYGVKEKEKHNKAKVEVVIFFYYDDEEESEKEVKEWLVEKFQECMREDEGE